MASKNISITEDVYNKLVQIKRENESFSELITRLLESQKKNLEKAFGSWDLKKDEKEEIWDPIIKRDGRSWKKPIFGD
ncbi:MAG: antitoxin [Promethearchaeota archaeon]|nr:MAG: antitoxin [Candidatus Lokiarchaeota archaeon]